MSASEPIYAPFFGIMGSAAAIIFSVMGAAYGTAKSGTGIAAMAVMKPDLIIKAIVPVVMAGLLAIYGLVISLVISTKLTTTGYTLFKSFVHFGAGLSCGLCSLGAGYAIGIVGDAGVRGIVHQPRLYIGMVRNLIFSEVLGLYGFIIALVYSIKF